MTLYSGPGSLRSCGLMLADLGVSAPCISLGGARAVDTEGLGKLLALGLSLV